MRQIMDWMYVVRIRIFYFRINYSHFTLALNIPPAIILGGVTH